MVGEYETPNCMPANISMSPNKRLPPECTFSPSSFSNRENPTRTSCCRSILHGFKLVLLSTLVKPGGDFFDLYVCPHQIYMRQRLFDLSRFHFVPLPLPHMPERQINEFAAGKIKTSFQVTLSQPLSSHCRRDARFLDNGAKATYAERTTLRQG